MLAGTLGALLLLPFVIANTPNAYANIFLIDNFTDDTIGMVCDQLITNTTADISPSGFPGIDPNPTSFNTQSGLSDVILGVRECQLFSITTNPPSSAATNVAQSAGMFRQMAGTGVESMAYLQYDGMSVGAGRILNLNLLNSDNLRVQYSKADFETNVTATIIDGSGNSASLEGKLTALTNTLTNLNFPLANFVVVNPLLSLADIDEINVNFTTNVDSTDYDIDRIDITMQMVGGEMFPTDTTALLLAGAELNAIWILPAIAAIGIGAFIVSRKRK